MSLNKEEIYQELEKALDKTFEARSLAYGNAGTPDESLALAIKTATVQIEEQIVALQCLVANL